MIKCTVMESSLGLMEKVTKVSMLKMRSKVRGDSTMEMGHFMRGTGSRVDSTVEASSEIRVVRYTKVDTSMGN